MFGYGNFTMQQGKKKGLGKIDISLTSLFLFFNDRHTNKKNNIYN